MEVTKLSYDTTFSMMDREGKYNVKKMEEKLISSSLFPVGDVPERFPPFSTVEVMLDDGLGDLLLVQWAR
jgi:hypothetical protein